MPPPPTPPRPAADAARELLAEILARGLEVPAEEAAFIAGTWGEEAAERLAAGAGIEEAEAESLIALLFSPPEEAVERVEALLGEAGWSRREIEETAQALCRRVRQVTFRLPGGTELRLPSTPGRLEGFIERLGVGRDLPGPLLEALERLGERSLRLRLRARVRRARISWTEESRSFLLRLLERLDLERPQDEEAFSFALELLGEPLPTGGVEALLATRKGLLLRARERGRRQRELLAATPVETLLARGERLIAVDEERLGREMAWIDRLSRAAFGRVFHEDAAIAQTAAAEGAADLEEIFRRFL
ncbi:MAG: hypothetical protein WHT06_14135 [Desulfobacterales bacterium]